MDLSTSTMAINMREHVLERFKFAAARYVSPSLLADSKVEITGMIAEDLIKCTLKMLIPGERVLVDTRRVPIGWWDHLLSDNRWLQPLFGCPQYDLIEVYTVRICPHVDIPWKRNSGPHLRFMDSKEEF